MTRAEVMGLLEGAIRKDCLKSESVEWTNLRDTVANLYEALEREKECQEQLAIRLLGKEAYDNSPCQVHPLWLVERQWELRANEADALLRGWGLDPQRFRTEFGNLNGNRVRAALLHPIDYSGLYLTERVGCVKCGFTGKALDTGFYEPGPCPACQGGSSGESQS